MFQRFFKWFLSLNLTRKILVIQLPLLILMVVVGMNVINMITGRSLDKQMDASLDVLIDITAESVKTGLLFSDVSVIEGALTGVTHNSSISYLGVFNLKNEEVFHHRGKGFSEFNYVDSLTGIDQENEKFREAKVSADGEVVGRIVLGISLVSKHQALAYSTRILLILTIIGLSTLALVFVIFARKLAGNINHLAEISEKISLGIVNQEVQVNSDDELGKLGKSFVRMIESLKVKSEAAVQLSLGNLDVQIEAASPDDALAKAMTGMKQSLKVLNEELNRIIAGQKAGEMNVRCQTDMVQGAYSNILNGVNGLVDALQNPILKSLEILQEYSSGNLENEMPELPGQQKQITERFNLIRSNLKKLVGETLQLTQAAAHGDFTRRGDQSVFSGDYREIIQGFNNTLDQITEKVFWFESILDSIPQPISVYNTDKKRDFVNRTLANDLNEDRRRLIGSGYSSIENSYFSTQGTPISRLERGEKITNYSTNGHHFQVESSYIHNTKGDVTGFVEIRQDITAIISAAEYTSQAVQELSEQLNRVAEGDLTLELSLSQGNEHSHKMFESMKALTNILQSTLNSIRRTLEQVNLTAGQVADGSKQVADTGQAVSQGATEQASSLEEVSSSISELSGQSKQNAEIAAQVNQLANAARGAAEVGNNSMRSMLTAMNDINQASDQISKIIKVIDEIAFQTNLLALNAAVEAARAGVHGKGFAVVAEEVRNLAQRSAKAAKETSDLIEGSVIKARNGSQIADQTARALGEIITGISRVTDLVGEISNSSQEQVMGIEQINQALAQIDQVTQTSAANAEESASASQQLSSQASYLKQLISSFRISDEEEFSEEVVHPQPVLPKPAHRPKKLQPGSEPKQNLPWGGQLPGRRHQSFKLDFDEDVKELKPSDIIALDDDEFGDF